MPELIYCAGGNRRFAELAHAAGFRLGARLPDTVYDVAPLYFADQEWRKPDRTRYVAEVARHQPYLATVLDLERPDQLDEVLGWAEEIAPHVREVGLIPKCDGVIATLPRAIGGRPVRLCYSVPSAYGGAELSVWEFAGWPVHLLGGSPHRQRQYARYLDVRSADGNYAQKLATRHCQFLAAAPVPDANNRWWPTLKEADGRRWEGDGPYEAFRRSCAAIRALWAAERPAVA